MDNGKTMAQWHEEANDQLMHALEEYIEQIRVPITSRVITDMAYTRLTPIFEQYGHDLVTALTNASDIEQEKLLQWFECGQWSSEFKLQYPLPESIDQLFLNSNILPEDRYTGQDGLSRYVQDKIQSGMYKAQLTFSQKHAIVLTEQEKQKYQELKKLCGDYFDQFLASQYMEQQFKRPELRAAPTRLGRAPVRVKDESFDREKFALISKFMTYRERYENSLSIEEIFKSYHLLWKEAREVLDQHFIKQHATGIDTPQARDAYDACQKDLSFQLARVILNDEDPQALQKIQQLKNMVTKVFDSMASKAPKPYTVPTYPTLTQL